ncbi:hypothetical protein GCM10009821_03940 [Aeromicrobium halocynthiae]|uniref:DUF6318 domain-containing protein n=1 Tax=Aeromicrobium halocynthiae TaxID=560557 RepID=A0ABN2VRD4_9ACTN
MRTTTAVAVALLVLLGACSRPEVLEPEPDASPTASARPAPTMPAQAREDTDEGRVAFVAHWIDMLNYASETGQTDELEKLSAAACAGCLEYINLYQDTYEAGGFVEGAQWEVEDLAIDQRDPSVVFVRYKAGEVRFRPSADSSTEVSAPTKDDLVFEVSGSPDDRRVTLLERAS